LKIGAWIAIGGGFFSLSDQAILQQTLLLVKREKEILLEGNPSVNGGQGATFQLIA